MRASASGGLGAHRSGAHLGEHGDPTQSTAKITGTGQAWAPGTALLRSADGQGGTNERQPETMCRAIGKRLVARGG